MIYSGLTGNCDSAATFEGHEAMNMRRPTDDQVEQTMGRLLRVGVIVSASVVLLGGVVYVARHGHEIPDYATFHSVPAPLRSITGTVKAVTAFEGQGIIQLGVLLLVATPVARVMLSVAVFALQRDWRYVMVTLFVLAVLFYSLARGYLEQSPDRDPQAGRLASPVHLGQSDRELLPRHLPHAPTLNETLSDRPHGRLGSIGNADLPQDVLHMFFYGLIADVQRQRDFLICQTECQLPEHFAFALSERHFDVGSQPGGRQSPRHASQASRVHEVCPSAAVWIACSRFSRVVPLRMYPLAPSATDRAT